MTNVVSIAQSGANNVTMRNRLINGGMVIDQRNAGSLGTYSGGLTYYLDRWRTYGTSSGKFTVQQTPSATETGYATRVAAGFRNYLNVTSTASTALGSTDIYRIEQPIEGYNIADLGFGTASPSVFTISFWVRSSLTGTFGGAVWNSDASRSCPFSYTISSANTWEYKTVTLTADSTGTWNTSNGQGLAVQWSLGAGSSYLGTAGTWGNTFYAGVSGQQNMIGTSGATFNITGAQLEKGSTATPFEQRLYTTELQLCQRYYTKETGYNVKMGSRYGANTVYLSYTTPVELRTTPTVANSGTNWQVINTTASEQSTTSTVNTVLNYVGGNVDVVLNTSFNPAAYIYMVISSAPTNSITFTAEL